MDRTAAMKVELIPYEKGIRHYNMKRCEQVVTSTGTHYFDGNKHQCGRAARFNVNGNDLCTQHAGQVCLESFYRRQQ